MRRVHRPIALALILLSAACAPLQERTAAPTGSMPAAPANTIFVSQGETVYTVAQRYGVPVRDLIEVNRLTPPYRLSPGQRLLLPVPQTHKVKAGDTLYGISRQYNLDLSELVRLNGIPAPYTIRVGQSLRLPAARTPAAPATQVAQAVPRPALVQPQGSQPQAAPPPATRRPGVRAEVLAPLPGTQAPASSSQTQGQPQTSGERPAGRIAPAVGLSPDDPGAAGQTPATGARAQPPAAASAPPAAPPTAPPAAPPTARAPAGIAVESLPPQAGQPEPASPGAKPPEPARPATAQTAAPTPAAPTAAAPASASPPPQVAIVQPPPPPAAEAQPAPRGGRFLWPVTGPIVSEFGPKEGGLHNDGINIGASKGTPVVAADSGVVAYAGNELRGFGNLLLIRHADGWVTAYAHLDTTAVGQGQAVKRGQKIGTVGQTGNVRSPQLHFEIRRGSRAIDPRDHLDGAGAGGTAARQTSERR